MTSTGIKENIIVHQYTGNHVYAYQMTTEGLTAVQSGKEILLYNTNGDMMAKVEAPHMSAAEGRYSTDIAVSLVEPIALPIGLTMNGCKAPLIL